MIQNDDPYNLSRFVIKQKEEFDGALQEIKNGEKESHWIWFIFPQLKQLGRSDMAIYYGIENSDEARAYYDNLYLRENLVRICEALLEHKGKDIEEIMGDPDYKKLRSSMTLFDFVSDNAIFSEVLDVFYGGERDPLTIELLNQ